ncbi:MAG: alpha-hydroxy-acid oxidizing protein [Paenibacillus dendritiformis]|uniref:alpha-hydroxy-acid oxidizing protein n=1 Tax=Paenibacillus dendritiformis TaxID=130049 RepID=UPI00143DEB67|nr:alpha-hydroxy-acid oxidizing protein [Paenibacillus dendritiformis]MDU5140813.1 alpha-hydroxy-acid oxidizing protein [Paenibacillus dendritiformis]NKI22557.1 alpha-hydroxy-acid oxidizing protein [Paenibacillus dendritiformis]NRG01211.1 alpha-hydroxy-acid oxidizing protein [Paenibacillus dendritiformis]
MTFDSEKLQMKIYESGDGAAKLLPVSFDEWESKAKSLLAAAPFGYVHGAAGAGDTNRSNVEAFQKYRIRPRVCCDITKRDMSISLFGAKLPFPVLFAPIGVNTILHPEGELAPARAASKLGIPYILSNVSSIPMETVAEAMGNHVRWFQLYPPKNHELTRSFLERAEAAGYSAIVVTVDSTLLGWRETDLRNAYLPFLSGQGMGNYFTDPVFCSMLKEPPDQDKEAAVKLALDEGNNTCFTWKELDFIRQQTRLPVLIKGITHPDDAVMALEHGVDGIIVSNHGGRQLDGAVATLDSLPAIGEAVQGKVPVLLDSGIRRGADILKAIALGADAVLIGRPYAYALAVAGETGVREVMEHLVAETELQLAISGKSSIREVDASLVVQVK